MAPDATDVAPDPVADTDPPAGDSAVVEVDATDAGPADAGPADAGAVDAAPADTGPVDAAPADAAPAGAAITDENAEAVPDEPALVFIDVQWPRPKYIYLATLSSDGGASEAAHERLAQMRADFRVPGDGTQAATLEVDMFWWDEPARAAGKSSPTYREGWHVVPISVTGSGRPAVSSRVDSPGRVLSSYTDYSRGPARTYYYLLRHHGGSPTTFRKLREALTAVGEKPSYDHAYMMAHKVDAILDLWPEINYSE